MSSKTKILLLKKRELIYTLLFAALAVILIVLMIWMFLPAVRKSSQASTSFSLFNLSTLLFCCCALSPPGYQKYGQFQENLFRNYSLGITIAAII